MILKIKGYPAIQVDTMVDYAPSAAAEITEITALADAGGSLGGKYFHLYSANNIAVYTIWFNVSSGNNPPGILNTTEVEVAISTNDSATNVASAMQTVITALTDFTAIVSSPDPEMIVVTNGANGSAIRAHDPSILSLDNAINGTGFGFVVTTNGEVAPGTPTGLNLVHITGRINDQTSFQQGNEYKESHFANRSIELIINERLILEVIED